MNTEFTTWIKNHNGCW